MIATSNLDGSNITEIASENTGNVENYPQLQVVGDTIYYTWQYDDGTNYQISISTSNLDGSDFIETNTTTTPSDKITPQLQVDFPNSIIYYTWIETVDDYDEIAAGTSGLNGENFITTNTTTTLTWNVVPQFQVVGSTIYYVWKEYVEDEFSDWWGQIAIGNMELLSSTPIPTPTMTRRHGVSYEESDYSQSVASTTLTTAPKSWLEEQLTRLFSHAPEKASMVAEPTGTQNNTLSRTVLILVLIVAAVVLIKITLFKPKPLQRKITKQK